MGFIHEKVYADTSLNISQEDFEKPESIGIVTACGKDSSTKDKNSKKIIPEDDDIDF